MSRFTSLLTRGLTLHCPVCGRGKLFKRPFSMYEYCPVCHLKYEREEGYFSSAMAIDLVISEFIVTAILIPLTLMPSLSIATVLAICLPLGILFPVLFFHHSRGLWMSMNHYFNPITVTGRPGNRPPSRDPLPS